MQYVSTRGDAAAVDFLTAIRAGLAPDGGLYVPREYPTLAPLAGGETYVETASRIVSAFAGDTIPSADISRLVAEAYQPFTHDAVAPLRQIGEGRWLLELFHGPSLAFKDIAMRMIARIFDHVLTQRNERMTILCATSGDTGGAAAAAFAGAKSIQVVILHPLDRISPVQRRFMTATGADNIHNLALKGDFDGTQKILKSLLADTSLREQTGLAAVNSINWLRIAAQSVYFARVQAALGADRPLQFVAPTGNFGDALSGYVAGRCGLIEDYKCLAAVNENDAIVTLFEGKPASGRPTRPTLSPAMDIQAPSNFERILYDACDHDGARVKANLNTQRPEDPELAAKFSALGFSAEKVSDDETTEEIRRTHKETGLQICPHTAVGVAAARRLPPTDRPVVVLGTAHPAKFPEVVRSALSMDAPLPKAAIEATSGDERFETGPMTEEYVRDKLLSVSGAAS